MRVPKNIRENQYLTITFPEFDFGLDIPFTGYFRLPGGFTAELVKIGLMVTEAFACDAAAADIRLGTSDDDDAYAKLEIADGAAVTDFQDETDDTDAIIEKRIPKDQLLKLTLTQSTDGTADAGKGLPMLMFEIRYASQ